MNHHFDVDLARTIGLHESLIVNHLQYWIYHNKANNANFNEGKTWTYNTTQAFQQIFPYLTLKQLRNAIENLLTKGIIIKNQFNSNPYNRTLWYAFVDEKRWLPDYQSKNEQNPMRQNTKQDDSQTYMRSSATKPPICPIGQMDLPVEENGFARGGKCITDIIPYIIPGGGQKKQSTAAGLEKKEEEKTNTVPAAAPQTDSGVFSFADRQQAFYQRIIEFRDLHLNKYPAPCYSDFFNYWIQPNPTKTRMKFEDNTYFGIAFHLNKFWKKTTSSEREVYWRDHEKQLQLQESIYKAKQLEVFN